MKGALGVLLLGCVFAAEATIAPGDKVKHVKQLKTKKGPQDDNVFDRHLVDEEPSPRDILVNNAAYYKDTTLRNFNGTVLGYVTAWNAHGYDIAKMFAKKFDIISPVWFQIVKRGEAYILAGMHDVDAGWLRDVRIKGKRQGSTLKIFPRVIFDKFTERDFSRLLSYASERSKVNDVIVSTCRENNFDGIVIEFWAQLGGRIDDQYLYTLLIEMAQALQKFNLQLILVIPPFRAQAPNIFGEKQLDKLYKHIYAFSLMTYDYSSVQRPGANSPLDWVRSAIEHVAPLDTPDLEAKRRKILMGMNMYGNDYTPDGGGPIVAHQYLQLLSNMKKRLAYDERDVENYFEIRTDTGRHYVFYPTLYSINERIKLAKEMGVGISIWELGQGLDYFYDLF